MAQKRTLISDVLWVEHLSPVPDALRLFCFPYAGGSAQIFKSWQRRFPAGVDVCLVHLPGRDRRIGERPFTHLHSLVQAIADALAPELRDPFAFYGHSMGALISFELARELRRRKSKTPRHLFLSGRQAPTVLRRGQPTFDLPRDEFIAAVKRLSGTPPELFDDPELRDLFIPLLRADFEIVETYVYKPEEPLACPLTVYGGLADEHVPIQGLREWRKQTSVACTEKLLPGDHFFIQNSTNGFLEVLRSHVLNVLSEFKQLTA